jgi:peptide/nickel transport system substrate-binding protein
VNAPDPDVETGMENRFGVKDFVLFSLVGVVIALVVLGMFQFDRQWEIINQANRKLSEQGQQLSQINKMLSQGAGPSAAGNDRNRRADDALKSSFPRIEHTRAAPDYAQGDTIVGTFISPPTQLTPMVSTDAGSQVIQSYVQEGLYTFDPNTQAPIPRLAIDSHVSDDQLTMDFDLRKGVTFSDGSPFSADDVVYTFNLMQNKDIEAVHLRVYFDTLDHVEKTGEYSVRFKFNRPYFQSFREVAGLGIQSKTYYGKYDAKTYNQSTGLLVGTGPYRLASADEWKPSPGVPVELVRNPSYWGIAPAADKLVWKVIPNPVVRQTAFRNGETDTFSPQPEQYDALLKDPALVARTQHSDLEVPTAPYTYIGWNEKIDGKPTRFADPKVRRAMTELLDREAICKDVMRGYASVNTSCFSSLTQQADPAIKPWPFDPADADKLLAEAGYHKQNDVLVGPEGQPFRFTLTYNTNNSTRGQVASYVKDALAKAGIIVDVDGSEWSVEIQKLKDHKLEAVLLGWTGVVESDPYQIFSTTAIANSGSNTISYSNPALDQAMQTARAIKDDAPRMLAWHKVHQILHEDQPYTFLFILHELDFEDGRFKGVEPTLTGLNSQLEWYVPAKDQKYAE